MLGYFFLGFKLTRSVRAACKALYSQQFDMADLVEDITIGDDPRQLLRAYIAISVAAQLTEPVAAEDIRVAGRQYRKSVKAFASDGPEAVLELHKALAETSWELRMIHILQGAIAFKENPLSVEGIIYHREKVLKGPMSSELRARLESLAIEHRNLEDQLAQVEGERAIAVNHAIDDFIAETIAEIAARGDQSRASQLPSEEKD